MRQLLPVALMAGMVASCGRADFALQVQVTAPSTGTAKCTRVTATRGADSLVSDPAPLTPDGSVDVLIALDSADEVTVQAAGFDTADCAGTPVAQSEQRSAAPTKTAPFPVVQLTLAPITTNTDGGTDAGFDAGFDAGADDAGFDGGADDAGFDGGMDDAGFDGGLDDAGFDGGLDDAGFDAGIVDAGPECTLATVGQSCASGTGTCNFEGVCLANFPIATSNFTVADLPATDGGVVINANGIDITINTSDGGSISTGAMPPFITLASDAGYPGVMVLHVDGLLVDKHTLTIIGDLPLIIAVSGDVNITKDGIVTVNAGRNAPVCGASTGQPGPMSGDTWSGGAGGGGFGRAGADGGASGGNGAVIGGPGGVASGNDELTPLRGGCAGGTAANSGGAGGAGGGALQLTVSGLLRLHGKVSLAGLGGGRGGIDGEGGGGGGSGGALLLEANSLNIGAPARYIANGGGGGGGAGDNRPGGAGEDGHPADATAAAGGTAGTDMGSGIYAGSAGGAGDTLTSTAGNGAGGSGGGGGGGGGVGRIRVNANNICKNGGAVISPPFTGDGGTVVGGC